MRGGGARKKGCRKRQGASKRWSGGGIISQFVQNTDSPWRIWSQRRKTSSQMVTFLSLLTLVCLFRALLSLSATTAWIMQSLVCLPRAPQIVPQANNELSIRQWNLKDRVVSFPDSMACVSVNTGQIALFEFNRGFCVSFLSARWNFQLLITQLLKAYSVLFSSFLFQASVRCRLVHLI